MIKSMTGYGKGEAVSEQGRFTVEIRSVNHRYGEISIRMPRGFMSLENEIKKSYESARYADYLARLDGMEERANNRPVPVAYAHLLYTLREHIHLVRTLLERKK